MYDTCYVADAVLPEYYHLFTVLHPAVRVHVHAVHQGLIFKVFLHLRDIDHVSLRQFLEFLVVDVCSVESHNLIMLEMTGSEHEGVVGGC